MNCNLRAENPHRAFATGPCSARRGTDAFPQAIKRRELPEEELPEGSPGCGMCPGIALTSPAPGTLVFDACAVAGSGHPVSSPEWVSGILGSEAEA